MNFHSRTPFFFWRLTLIIIASISWIGVHASDIGEMNLNEPQFYMEGIEAEIILEGSQSNEQVFVNGKRINCESENGDLVIKHTFGSDDLLVIKRNNDVLFEKRIRVIPIWLSILPPLIAIALALIFREVISSLFIGIYLGAFIPAVYMDGWASPFTALFSLMDRYVLNALNNTGHLSVIVFSMLIGACVHVISKNGGMNGVVAVLSNYAKSRRSGQFVTWLLGVLIFFDDYANTLIVGNTMRPITDRLRISRAKLSYIVDSTAAPIAAIAFVTTWIGAELGYIEDGISAIDGINQNVYEVFLYSLQFSFYPLLTLIFIAMLIYMKKDFGPMYGAETAVIESEVNSAEQHINVSENEMRDFEPDEKIPVRWFNAVIPVLVIIFCTIFGLIQTGWDDSIWANPDSGFFGKLSDTIGQADAYKALLWSSILGLVTAILLSLGQKLLNLQQAIGSVINGFKTMLTAMIILVLAWSLSNVTEDLHTADFLTELISGNMTPYLFPAAIFVLAGLVSFSTGSSWGSMAILYPLMLPLSWTICQESGLDYSASMLIFYNTVSSVLAGSVLGDHCSPISDTTILSSLASSCDHIEHVRTQMPYALTVGAVGTLLGTIPSAFGVPPLLCFLAATLALFVLIRQFGRSTA